ncbi:hypothetical protein Tco_1000602, partial [Tanacetum coccineum]
MFCVWKSQSSDQRLTAMFNSVRQNVNSGRQNVNSVNSNINTGKHSVNSGSTNIKSVRPNVNTGKHTVNSGSFNFNSARPQRVIGELLLRPQQVMIGEPQDHTPIIIDHPLKNMMDRGIFDSG